MRICRFDDNRIGVVDGAHVRDVTDIRSALRLPVWPRIYYDPLVELIQNDPAAIRRLAEKAKPIPLSGVRLLSPVATPSRIIALPTSYRSHVQEAKSDPILAQHITQKSGAEVRTFIKASPSLVGPGEGVAMRFTDKRNDPELELAIVIGRPCDRVSEADALKYVAGYTIGLDMTLRESGPPSGRKSIDTYSVLGPWLVTSDELPDASNLQMTLRVNGEVRQKAPTSDLLYSLPQIIAYCASMYHMQPGDVIMTGTPDGVAPIKPGDVLDAEIEGIGAMKVAIRAYG